MLAKQTSERMAEMNALAQEQMRDMENMGQIVHQLFDVSNLRPENISYSEKIKDEAETEVIFYKNS